MRSAEISLQSASAMASRAVLLALLCVALSGTLTAAAPCVKHFPDASDTTTFMCVCTESSCDDIEDLGDNEGMALYTTSLDGDRLTKAAVDGNGTSADVTLSLDTSKTEQTIIGFGGAMTDATVINLNRLKSDLLRQQIIKGYFGVNGLRYNLIRIPIASCDFSTREYSYLDTPNDWNLQSFALVNEDTWKIDFTKQAMSYSNATQVLSSPWSAPAWMKSNGHMRGGGTLKDGAQYSQTYAQYLARFVEEYAARGVPIWAMTVQNEPSTGLRPDFGWQTMYFSPAAERDFLRDYLSPALLNSPSAKATQILIHDHNRPQLQDYADNILSDPDAEKLVAGIAIHWYEDNGTDPMILTNVSLKHPRQFMLYTESCIEGGTRPGVFAGAFRYANNILEDLTHRVAGWVDWNLVLNMQGGPNWVANYVDSPILIADTNDAFYRQPMFYAMGHFSRFIARGATRVGLDVSSSAVQAGAFLNPDKSVVVVIINNSPNLVQAAIGNHTVAIKASSINTLYFKDESYVGKIAAQMSLLVAIVAVLLHQVVI